MRVRKQSMKNKKQDTVATAKVANYRGLLNDWQNRVSRDKDVERPTVVVDVSLMIEDNPEGGYLSTICTNFNEQDYVGVGESKDKKVALHLGCRDLCQIVADSTADDWLSQAIVEQDKCKLPGVDQTALQVLGEDSGNQGGGAAATAVSGFVAATVPDAGVAAPVMPTTAENTD